TFSVKSADGTSSSVTVTIQGTNDVAVISGINTGSVTEDTAVNASGNLTTGGTLSVADVDNGHAVFQAQPATAGAYGTFTLAADGTWTYAAANSNAAVQALRADQSLTETFSVKSADGTSSSVTVTIKGANDAAVISGATSGTFTLATDGTWTYSAANSNATIQALRADQSLTETFSVKSADGTSSSVTVT